MDSRRPDDKIFLVPLKLLKSCEIAAVALTWLRLTGQGITKPLKSRMKAIPVSFDFPGIAFSLCKEKNEENTVKLNSPSTNLPHSTNTQACTSRNSISYSFTIKYNPMRSLLEVPAYITDLRKTYEV